MLRLVGGRVEIATERQVKQSRALGPIGAQFRHAAFFHLSNLTSCTRAYDWSKP